MPTFLRQSTASQEVLLGPFLDSTDGVTAETALTINNTDIQIWKTGGTTEANKTSGGATHIAGGRYYAVLDATDTNTIGPLRLSVQVAGALAVWLDCCVLDEAVYDVLFGTTAPSTYAGADTSGTTTLLSRVGAALTITAGRVDADVTHIAAAAVSTSTAQLGVNVVNFGGAAGTFAAGIPAVNATQLSGDSVAADNAEAFFDGTGYAGTNNVIPLVTTTTTATNVTTVNGLAANVLTAASLAADAGAEIADAVWDEVLSGHLTGGTTGAALNSAGSAGDPWGTALPGAYSAGSAGHIIGNRIDAAVSSRMATYTQPTGFLAATFPATVGTSTLTQTEVTGGAYSVQSALCVLGDARIANLDAAVSTRAAAATALSTATWTGVTAGRLDTLVLDYENGSLQCSVLSADNVGNVTGNVSGNVAGNVAGNVSGNVAGKVLGGGAGTITGTGARVVDASGNNVSTLDAAGVRTAVGMASANLDTQLAALDTLLDSILADTGTDGVVLSAAMCNKIADHTRRRTQANVEASSDGDTLGVGSLYGFLQQAQESAVSGATLTIKKTDGTTTLGTKTVTATAGADPVTGIA